MPLFMDVHRNLGKVTLDDVANAHLKDMEVQEQYGVCYHKYWFNKDEGSIYCLVEGPDAAACERVHREAHGLVADDIIEVEPRLVDIFLNADVSALGAAITQEGTVDSGLRVVVFTEVANLADVVARSDRDGLQLLNTHDHIVRDALTRHHGREVKHTGEGIMACFASVRHALNFAEAVHKDCATHDASEKPLLRVGITAGEPVEANKNLFGVSVGAARKICQLTPAGGVLVSGAVRELAVGKGFQFDQHDVAHIDGMDAPVTLFSLQIEVTRTAALSSSRAAGVRKFWYELKRRHVVTVGAAYLAVLFVLLQVASLTFEPLNLPDWAYQFLLIVGIFGFPLALVLAWAFDLKFTTK
ncbi:MAG TPA: nickel-binding protein [Longimicrobiales bacterium]|nr:nickel-binding protein [Longimicrobiales bacterium]